MGRDGRGWSVQPDRRRVNAKEQEEASENKTRLYLHYESDQAYGNAHLSC